MMILTLTLAGLLLSPQTPPIQPQVTPVALPQDITMGEGITPVKITGEEAAQIALAKNPRIRLARSLYNAAHGRTLDSRSGLFPSLVLGGSGTDVDTIRTPPPTNGSGGGSSTSAGYSATVTVRQLLFDFGHTLAVARQAMANEKAAYHAVTRTEQDLAFQTKQAYYTYVLNAGLVAVQEANVKDRQAQFDLAQARFQAGPGQPSDVLRAQTALADAMQQVVQARTTALASRIALATIMGIDSRTPIAPSESQEPAITTSFSDLFKQALDSRPDLLQSLDQLRAAGYEVQAAKTNNAPAFSLNAGYNAKGVTDFTSNQSATLGLGVAWSIIDGGSTQGKIQVAKADVETARANLELLQLSIGSDVATAWSNLQFAEQRLPIVESELKNAQENLRIAQGRFQAGLGTFLEVTDAEASLISAQQAVVSARTNIWTARAALLHAVGK